MKRGTTKTEDERGESPAGRAETEPEERRSRRNFALVMGAAGPAAVLLTMNQFIPTGETWAMTGIGMVIWLGVYGALARRAVEEEKGDRSLLPVGPEGCWAQKAPVPFFSVRGAIGIGVVAFLVHSAIDFDFEVMGVTMPLAGMLAAGIALREKRGQEPFACRPGRVLRTKGSSPLFTFGTGGQLALTAAVAAPLALVLIFLIYPLIDMSVALGEAQKLEENQNLTVKLASDARKRGDVKTYQEYMRRARRIEAVEIPARYQKAIAAFPGNAEPYVELAKMEAAPLYGDPAGDRSKVEKLLDEAKRLRPRDPTPWVMLAEMFSSQIAAAEEKGEAELIPALAKAGLEEIEGAIKRYPAQPQFRLIRARLLERISRREEAVKEYETALSLAEETSEKELKFTPGEVEGIRKAIEKLKGKK